MYFDHICPPLPSNTTLNLTSSWLHVPFIIVGVVTNCLWVQLMCLGSVPSTGHGQPTTGNIPKERCFSPLSSCQLSISSLLDVDPQSAPFYQQPCWGFDWTHLVQVLSKQAELQWPDACNSHITSSSVLWLFHSFYCPFWGVLWVLNGERWSRWSVSNHLFSVLWPYIK